MEWNTPAIQTVEVSADSSGVSRLPERRMCAWGRSTCSSLAFRTTCRRLPAKKDNRRPSASRSGWRRSVPNSASISASERSSASSSGAVLNKLAQRLCSGRRGPLGGRRGFRQRQGPLYEREVGVRRCSRVVGLEPPEKAACGAGTRFQPHRCVLNRRHGVLVLVAQAGQPLRHPRRGAAGAGGKPMDLERVGGEACSLPQAADEAPRVAAAHGLVLPAADHPAPRGMGERRLVEVLAHEVLVEAHRGVLRESQVLDINHVHRRGRCPRVLQHHVPVPGDCRLGQGHRHREPDARPFAGERQALPVVSHAGGARGPNSGVASGVWPKRRR